MTFLTETTPGTLRAMDSAVDLSLALLAKPDSMTVPFIVSTLMAEASTLGLSTKRALTEVVITLSSM
jgi:hypothetical protein